MRAAAFIMAAALAAIPALALAESGSGEIACQNQVRQLNRQLQERAGQMDPGQVQYISRRLQIANEQCPQGLNAALPQLSQIQQELNGAPQTAQVPGSGPPLEQSIQ